MLRTHVVTHDRQHGLSAHLHQPDVGGQSYMADEDALGVECVSDWIVRGDADHRPFGVAGSQQPRATLIRDHQGISGSLCLRYRHVGQVLLVDSHRGFGIGYAPQLLNEHRRGKAIDLSGRSIDLDPCARDLPDRTRNTTPPRRDRSRRPGRSRTPEVSRRRTVVKGSRCTGRRPVLRRLSPAEATGIADEAGRQGRVTGLRLPLEDQDEEPWTAPPSRRLPLPETAGAIPERIEAVLGDQLYIPV